MVATISLVVSSFFSLMSAFFALERYLNNRHPYPENGELSSAFLAEARANRASRQQSNQGTFHE